MGTTRIVFALPGEALLPSTNFGRVRNAAGTNNPVAGISLAKTSGEEGFFLPLALVGYGSGNITAKLRWYAVTGSTGDIVLGGSVQALTPDSDTQDIETDGFDTETTVTDSHLGTTNKRLHEASLTLSNLDSLANLDRLVLRFRRKNSGSDNMAGDACIVSVVLEYSDT